MTNYKFLNVNNIHMQKRIDLVMYRQNSFKFPYENVTSIFIYYKGKRTYVLHFHLFIKSVEETENSMFIDEGNAQICSHYNSKVEDSAESDMARSSRIRLGGGRDNSETRFDSFLTFD